VAVIFEPATLRKFSNVKLLVPTAARGLRLWLALILAFVLPLSASAQALDATRSHFSFELRTFWGQVIVGNFPRYEGEVAVLPDGRHQVNIRLATADVEVDGPGHYTRFARSERFLDAEHHPWVAFQSEPYAPELVRSGGPLRGVLNMRGISRTETFILTPSDCPRPGYECDVAAQGSVSRTDYGLESWRWALTDQVRFNLRVRLQEAPL
jgi:polyisoprenoid-binding protein YceI